MGGCRCTFRNCENNTINSPGMHFFHFPFKDVERCKKWALNAGKVEFLNLPWTQLRNKTVCETHFTMHCFMNIKQERLIQKAVPTIYVGQNGDLIELDCDEKEASELEYEFGRSTTDGQETGIDLPTAVEEVMVETITLQPHMGSDDIQIAEIIDREHIDEASTIAIGEWIDPVVLKSDAKMKPTRSNESKSSKSSESKPIVLNYLPTNIELTPPKTFAVKRTTGGPRILRRKIDSVPPSKKQKIAPAADQTPTITETLEFEMEDDIIVANEQTPANTKKYTKPKAKNLPATLRHNNAEDKIDEQKLTAVTDVASISSAVSASVIEQIKHIQEQDSNKVDKALYLQAMADHAKQIDELKKLLTEKLEKSEAQNQMATSTPSSSSSEVRHIRVEKGPAMTKVQLFNGIRKYLNPTMVALLRMEIFGGSERDYRPDEKQLCKELYNLNQTVYDYMRDEWRFRLPRKTEVEEWLKDPDEEETWELC